MSSRATATATATRRRWPTRCMLLVATFVLLFTQTGPFGRADESQQANTTSPATSVAPTTTSTSTTTTTTSTTTTAAPATSQTTLTTTTTAPTTSTPALDVDKVKKVIREHITPAVENRFAMNKPTSSRQTSEFGPESIEVKVADATTQFGLNFIKSLELPSNENILISPISLQNLLNMILLGSDDQSQTQIELIKTLGYEQTDLLTAKSASETAGQRLRPHEAMHNLLDSISRATHLMINAADHQQLLNTNPGAFTDNSTSSPSSPATPSSASTITAHLQTAGRDNEPALSGQVNFTLANLLLTDDNLRLSEEFERSLKQFYNVKVESFGRPTNSSGSNAPSNSTGDRLPLHEKVNKWVRNVTQNQIEELASESDLAGGGSDLLMVLLNAAHFKGHWLYTFNPKATYERVFFNDGLEKRATEVKFMRQKATFGYADFGQSAEWAEAAAAAAAGGSSATSSSSEDAETLLTEDAAVGGAGPKSANPASSANNSNNNLPIIELSKEEARRLELTSKLNCSVLQLPFSLNDGQELSMVILLPSKRDGLADLIASLSYQALNEIYRSLSEQQVQVELPKFAFEAAHDAKTTLKRMGLSGIFSEAQLERMFVATNTTTSAPGTSATTANKTPKKVGKLIHKAKISVDEAGAEAAAASMATIVLRNFIRPPSPVFVADHPFLFIIRHNKSNVPLFMGRLSSLH